MEKPDILGTNEDALPKGDKLIRSIVAGLYFASFMILFTILIGGTIDSIIISKFLGENSLGAYGLTQPLYNLIEVLCGFVATGTVVMCSNLIGSGKGKDANDSFSAGFTFSLILGFTFALILFLFPQTVRLIITPGETEQFMPLVLEYVRGLTPAIPFMILSTLMIPIVQLDGNRKTIVISAFVLCITNIAGDIIVVTLTSLGLLGIGLATSLSYLCSAAVLYSHFLQKKTVFHPHFGLAGLKQSLSNGIPTLWNSAATLLRNYSFNFLALAVSGPAGLIAWSTVGSLSSFLCLFSSTTGQETLVGSGVFYGERDKDSLIRFMKFSLVFGLTIVILVIIAVLITAPFLVRLYLDPASESYAMAVRGLRWYSLCLLPLTLTVILAYYLQSAKQKLLPRIIFFADGFGALAIFAFFLAHFIDLDGLWLSFFLGKSAVLIGTLIYICAKRKTLRPTVSDLLLLPKGFDVPAEDMLILTIDNDRAVTETSERIMKFCTDRGIEYRRSYFAGLALEEMVAIIAEKGFGNNRKYNIDIKVFITDGQIDIRLRDNFMYFDTAKRMEIMNSEDGISNIGIRIINSISHDTEYYSTLNVNYLVMHIAPQKQIPAQPKASLSSS